MRAAAWRSLSVDCRLMPAAADTLVAFRGVEKRYAATGRPAVSCLDLTIERGEFLTLLGPSGSGKTTTLMLLAGFEAPSTGEILLNAQIPTGPPPHNPHPRVPITIYVPF